MSAFFIPENAAPVLNKTMVSIDFHAYSMMALARILSSALTWPNIDFESLYIYHVPQGQLGEGRPEFGKSLLLRPEFIGAWLSLTSMVITPTMA